ncbi:hypothetical protein ACIHFC_32895 [Streptomyces sp. NPDC052013]|uniref:hypothetical protein n=1 Tax=Streptomyces sp. NPDC052013 TaxID=3365679 RepID=UPI0037D91436
MSKWTTTGFRSRLAAPALAAGLAAVVTGCSDGNRPHHPAPAAASQATGFTPHGQQEPQAAPLAELQGTKNLVLTITSAQRNPDGHLTVRGEMTNRGSERTVVPAQLRGHELDVVKAGQSLAGATLVDFTHHKRYYVLRDTDGRPLTTTGLTTLKAGERVRVFLQFPAPPPSTTTVGFQLPLFDTATIKITG